MLRGDLRKGLLSLYLVGLLIIVGFTGFLVLDGLFDEHSVSAAGKNIYVSWKGHGNYTTIQSAIDNANANDTIYVWAGIYHEDLIVNKTLKLIGNGTSNTTIYGTGIGDVITITANGSNISGFYINNSGKDPVYWKFGGIKLEGVKNCTISNNFCSENDNGITLEKSNSNLIQNNTCVNNKNSGINLNPTGYFQTPCHKNVILDNNCSLNSFAGISHNRGDYNKYKNNSATLSSYGFFFSIGNYNQIENNNVSDNQYSIYLFLFDFSIINNNTCNNSIYGIYLYSFNDYNLLFNNTCTNNQNYGLYISLSSNNSFIKNNCSTNYWKGVYQRDSLYNRFINNNVSTNYDNGIEIRHSHFTKFTNNSCSRNYNHGISIFSSNNITFENNTCNYNGAYGIYQRLSSNSTMIKNNCSYNYVTGIILYVTSNFTILNNNCSFNPIAIYTLDSNNNTIDNNTCNYNDEIAIYLSNSINNYVSNNSFYSNWGTVIYLAFSSNNIVENNYLLNNPYGINLYYSDYNRLIKNYLKNTTYRGIEVLSSKGNYIKENTIIDVVDGAGILIYGEDYYWPSENNYISNNTCSQCNSGLFLSSYAYNNTVTNNNFESSHDGIYLYGHCINNVIKANYCSNNSYGIYMWSTDGNHFLDNYCSDNEIGIYLIFSNNNIIDKNTCSLNSRTGIHLSGSDYNSVSNNTCNSNNLAGISVEWSSYNNKVENNTCNSNTWSGIDINGIYTSTLMNNTCKNNQHGINISWTYYNQIQGNELANNDYGVSLTNYSYYNNLSENLISDNNLVGIYIKNNAENNSIFHNMIISNTNQAVDPEGNHWNNSYQEGNYWSDYNGLDNGANGRIAGDGIGDTKIPHLGLDNYPFMKSNGWLESRAPGLLDPGEVDLDGEFDISWIGSLNAEGYILEGDDNKLFESPKMLYNGSETEVQVTEGSEGVYYYRVKSYNENSVSKWSNIVDIFVDLKPEVPKNLRVSVWNAGNAVNISWDPNKFDVTFFELQFKTISDWSAAVLIHQPEHTYNHTGLKDGIRYTYRIRAFDRLNRSSDYSAEVYGVPDDSKPPEAPTDLKIPVKTFDSLFITWIKPTDEDVSGYNVYRSKTEQPDDWGQPINGKELIQNTYYNDSGLGEGETYYYVVSAVDEVPLESVVSNEVSERTYLINEYPQAPVINNPLPDFNITEDTIDDKSINLLIWFKDINNDILVFHCEGQDHINVTIDHETGKVVLTPEPNWNGQEVLTFHATDGKFNISDQVMITVTPVNDQPGPINIISPNDGVEINTETAMEFQAECTDPDLPYGDILEFNWSSSISGNLGTGENLNNVYLEKGKHVITLTVKDSEGESVSTTIEISVKDSTDAKTAKDFWDESGLGFIVIGIIIVIIVIIIIILFVKRKKTYERTTSEFTFEPKTPTWQKSPKEEMTQEELEDHLLTEEE